MKKICVYTICKNESKYLERWYNSVKEADCLCVLDTGSTDDTYSKLLELQNKSEIPLIVSQKIIEPWGFADARNESLKLIPSDIYACFVVDIDEYLEPGWCNYLRNQLDDNKLIYNYFYREYSNGKFIEYSVRRRMHLNKSNISWIYEVNEQLVINGTFNSQFDKWIQLPFKIFHTPEKVYNKNNGISKRESYSNLRKVKMKSHGNESMSLWSYVVCNFKSFLLSRDYETPTKLLKQAEENTSDELILGRIYGYLSACFLLKNEKSDYIEKFYEIEKNDFVKDPYLIYLKALLFQRRYDDSVYLIKKIIDSNCSNFLNNEGYIESIEVLIHSFLI